MAQRGFLRHLARARSSQGDQQRVQVLQQMLQRLEYEGGRTDVGDANGQAKNGDMPEQVMGPSESPPPPSWTGKKQERSRVRDRDRATAQETCLPADQAGFRSQKKKRGRALDTKVDP